MTAEHCEKLVIELEAELFNSQGVSRCGQQIRVSTLQNQRLSTILPLHLRHQSQKLPNYQ